MSDLAIVIPAYKAEYLQDTLQSIANQSCKDFTVYVGDDASPYCLGEIVSEFSDVIDIRYHRFNDNIGGQNLVAQWERCLDLIENEKWVWLFSDDDIMESKCVKEFYDCVEKDSFYVLHFNISIIDGEGNIIRECAPYKNVMSSSQFYADLYRHRIDARMPEFVFKAEKLRKGGFIEFDLAWRTDNATVMKCASETGILTISCENTKVLWRAGSSNISAFKELRERKNHATIDFFNWAYEFFGRKVNWPILMLYQLKCILFEFVYSDRKTFMADCRLGQKKLKYVKFWNTPLWYLLALYRIYYRRHDMARTTNR